MKLYVTEMSLFFLALFYLPLVIWALWKLLKQPIHIAKKTALAILLLVVAYVIPLGDVTVNSLAMAKVCPTAGLHIYKTVEVEGYIDSGSEVTLRQSPYKFVESPQLEIGNKYHWIRSEKQPDGSIAQTKLDKPTAEYEVLTGGSYPKFNGFNNDPAYDPATHTINSRWLIRNRKTGEVIAEWRFITGLPGWLDMALVYRWFGSGGPGLSCTKGSDFSVWPEKVLIPKQSVN